VRVTKFATIYNLSKNDIMGLIRREPNVGLQLQTAMTRAVISQAAVLGKKKLKEERDDFIEDCKSLYEKLHFKRRAEYRTMDPQKRDQRAALLRELSNSHLVLTANESQSVGNSATTLTSSVASTPTSNASSPRNSVLSRRLRHVKLFRSADALSQYYDTPLNIFRVQLHNRINRIEEMFLFEQTKYWDEDSREDRQRKRALKRMHVPLSIRFQHKLAKTGANVSKLLSSIFRWQNTVDRCLRR
jgi:hypothetical protein